MKNYADDFESFLTNENAPKDRTFSDVLNDAKITAEKGAMNVTDSLLGLSNLATLGITGKIADKLGYDSNSVMQELNNEYSPALPPRIVSGR